MNMQQLEQQRHQEGERIIREYGSIDAYFEMHIIQENTREEQEEETEEEARQRVGHEEYERRQEARRRRERDRQEEEERERIIQRYGNFQDYQIEMQIQREREEEEQEEQERTTPNFNAVNIAPSERRFIQSNKKDTKKRHIKYINKLNHINIF